MILFRTNRPTYLLCLLTLGSMACGAQSLPHFDNPITAAVVMDMQVDFLDSSGKLPVEQSQVDTMLEATNQLTAKLLEQGDVVYVVNHFAPEDITNIFRNGAAVRGDPGAKLDDRVVLVKDNQFRKDQPSAFTNPHLYDYLVAHQAATLVVVGVFAEACVKATVDEALRLGFAVIVLQDGVAGHDDQARSDALEEMENAGAQIQRARVYFNSL